MRLTKEEEEIIRQHRANSPHWTPKKSTDYSVEEKAVKFDELHKLAMEAYEYEKDNGYPMKDIEHWCYEAVMPLLGDDVWDTFK